MFHTFAAVEPSFNNEEENRAKLGNNLEQKVYENYTFADLMREIQVSRASPDLVRAFKRRCATGIRVPEDYTTLNEATGFLNRFGGKYIPLFKDADEGHLLGNEKVKIPNTILLGKGEHVMAVYKDADGDDSNTLRIASAMNIVGDASEGERERLWSWVVFGSSKGFKGIVICNT